MRLPDQTKWVAEWIDLYSSTNQSEVKSHSSHVAARSHPEATSYPCRLEIGLTHSLESQTVRNILPSRIMDI
jgi:hypothetical protein